MCVYIPIQTCSDRYTETIAFLTSISFVFCHARYNPCWNWTYKDQSISFNNELATNPLKRHECQGGAAAEVWPSAYLAKLSNKNVS